MTLRAVSVCVCACACMYIFSANDIQHWWGVKERKREEKLQPEEWRRQSKRDKHINKAPAA